MLVDIHCHANLYLNLDEILTDAKKAGVHKIISVGMSQTSLARVIEISENHDMIYPALGIHPEEVKMNKKIDQNLDEIIEIIRENSNKICAIGEIGLDHYFVKDTTLYPIQTKTFKKMLSLAQELKLPINLHTKGAEKEIFEILSSYELPNVNIHWYSGPEELLKLGIERGYYFSITPAISYSPPVKMVVELVDQEHLLLESDGPVKYSGQIGTPSMIKDVLVKIAAIKKIDPGILEGQIEKNTKTVFPRIF
jgi:TatD DNase family protein